LDRGVAGAPIEVGPVAVVPTRGSPAGALPLIARTQALALGRAGLPGLVPAQGDGRERPPAVGVLVAIDAVGLERPLSARLVPELPWGLDPKDRGAPIDLDRSGWAESEQQNECDHGRSCTAAQREGGLSST